MIFGAAGAVIGSAGSRTLKENTNDYNNESIVNMYINDLENPIISIRCCSALNVAEQIIATLTVIKNQEQNK